MKALWEFIDFFRHMRRQMRFGELSRAPLKMTRLEMREGVVECDWMLRAPDAWDADLRQSDRDHNVARQALTDAVRMRELIFSEFPGVDWAVLRAFQEPAREPLELVIMGTVSREDKIPSNVRSLTMRAKLLGFHFWLEDGILEALQSEENTVIRGKNPGLRALPLEQNQF